MEELGRAPTAGRVRRLPDSRPEPKTLQLPTGSVPTTPKQTPKLEEELTRTNSARLPDSSAPVSTGRPELPANGAPAPVTKRELSTPQLAPKPTPLQLPTHSLPAAADKGASLPAAGTPSTPTSRSLPESAPPATKAGQIPQAAHAPSVRTHKPDLSGHTASHPARHQHARLTHEATKPPNLDRVTTILDL